MAYHNPYTPPRKSAIFDDCTLAEIRRAATTGVYDIRGGGAKRKLPHFDDLLFLGASISRYPLEGYREKCETSVVLGGPLRQEADRVEDPDHHRRHEFRRAVQERQGSLGRGATVAGTSTTTGDGRHDRGRAQSQQDPHLSVSRRRAMA